MKKKSIIIAGLLTLSVFGFSQDGKTSIQKNENSIYTSLKPADATPYVFGSRQQLNDKQDSKKGVVLSEIKAHANNPEKLKALREELWRIENATVLNNK